MKQVVTKDDSITVYNEDFKEHYHSQSGAAEEAVKKFVEPTNIKELAKKGEVKILDICFGLGYNSAAAIDAIFTVNKDCKIEIIGLENDEEIFEVIKTITTPFTSYHLILKLAHNELLDLIEANIHIGIMGGDAKDSVNVLGKNEKVMGTFDLVFLDPFSPKVCPELWTTEFFIAIKKLMKKGAYLTTYSCASQVRKNLKEAGFTVKDGPIVGRRSPSTIALNL